MTEAGGTVHEGGCLCGAIRYRVAGDPLAVAICHCTNCRRNSGSAYSVNAIFPKAALELTGEPAVYEDRGDTGEVVRRHFCGRCGTPIESRSVFSAPAHAVIKAGTFDDPARFVPDTELYCASALPWVHGPDDRRRLAGIDEAAVAEAAAQAGPS